MGMFNDNVGAGRTGWLYKYKGVELLPYAVKLYKEFRSKEEESRNRMADFMKDMNIANNDRRVEDTKREIVSFGTLKEQCAVFKHEFSRNPEKEYELGLGDVTFFGLAEG
jgi:hypothetical protein